MPFIGYMMLYYSGCDVIHRKGVISSNMWVLWHRSCDCHVVYTGYDVVNYSGCDLRNTVDVISSIEWMWWHRYSGHDVKCRGCDDINTWFEVIKWGCDVLYSANDATHMASVMSSKAWVWCCLYCGCEDTDCGCDVSCKVYMLPYILDVVSYIEVVMSSVQ